MNGLRKYLIAASMAAAPLPNMLQAMDIVQFDQMTNQDRQSFLDSLSRHAETVETALISTLKKNNIDVSPDSIKALFQLTGVFQAPVATPAVTIKSHPKGSSF